MSIDEEPDARVKAFRDRLCEEEAEHAKANQPSNRAPRRKSTETLLLEEFGKMPAAQLPMPPSDGHEYIDVDEWREDCPSPSVAGQHASSEEHLQAFFVAIVEAVDLCRREKKRKPRPMRKREDKRIEGAHKRLRAHFNKQVAAGQCEGANNGDQQLGKWAMWKLQALDDVENRQLQPARHAGANRLLESRLANIYEAYGLTAGTRRGRTKSPFKVLVDAAVKEARSAPRIPASEVGQKT